jgi:hypothetical protein
VAGLLCLEPCKEGYAKPLRRILTDQAKYRFQLCGVCLDCAVTCCAVLCCPAAYVACRYIWVDFNEYDGEWRAGRLHGQGTFVWKTGERYDGEWKVSVEGSAW